jgi:hypothetical protein
MVRNCNDFGPGSVTERINQQRTIHRNQRAGAAASVQETRSWTSATPSLDREPVHLVHRAASRQDARARTPGSSRTGELDSFTTSPP